MLGSEAWGNKTKEMNYSTLNLEVISFVLFPQASEPSMNFNISKLVYCNGADGWSAGIFRHAFSDIFTDLGL